MRPRIPLRFDFNDVEMVKMNPKDPKTELLRKHYKSSGVNVNIDNLFRVKMTWYSIINTSLLYFLSVILIVSSLVNMKKIVGALQTDPTLSLKDKMMFRLGFIFSFFIVLFLGCVLALSVFELYRNWNSFSPFTKNNFRYKNIDFVDGNMGYIRYIILFFVAVSVLFAMAETLNLFFMKPNKPQILFLMLPIMVSLYLLFIMYFRYSNQ
jgi:hypothetical protein